MKPDYWDRAKRALARKDPVMAAIIRSRPKVFLARRGEPFVTLARRDVPHLQPAAARRISARRPRAAEGHPPRLFQKKGLFDGHGQARQDLAAVAFCCDVVPVALARSLAGRILTARRSARIARR